MTDPKFVVDCMLGKLAKKLRILGYDALYYRNIDDAQLTAIADEERRILLTRDTTLSRSFSPSLMVESEESHRQTKEVLTKLGLTVRPSRVLSRCLHCNSELSPVEKERVRGSVPPYVYRTQERFSRCSKCQRIYWKATHMKGMETFIGEIMGASHAFDDDSAR